jgi:4-carboxymuconolactone decarboxylase
MSRNSDFGTFGRYTELQLDEMTADQRKAYEFTVGQRGEVPGPYKIWLQNPKLTEVMVPLGAYYQGRSSLSKAEIEIATNLTNARWLAGYSNYEHEIIGERDGGLPPEKVEALIAGLLTSFEDPRPHSSPHCTTTNTGLSTAAFEIASLNFCMSGRSLCLGMFGMRS